MTIRRLNDNKHGNSGNATDKFIAHSHGIKARTAILQKRVVFETIKENRLRRHHRRSNALLLGNVSIVETSSNNTVEKSSCSLEIPGDNILSQLLSESVTELSETGSIDNFVPYADPSPCHITPSSSILSSVTSSSCDIDDDPDWSETRANNPQGTVADMDFVALPCASAYKSSSCECNSEDDSVIFAVRPNGSLSHKDPQFFSSLHEEEQYFVWNSSPTLGTPKMNLLTIDSWVSEDTPSDKLSMAPNVNTVHVAASNDLLHSQPNQHGLHKQYGTWGLCDVMETTQHASEDPPKDAYHAATCHDQSSNSAIVLMMHHIQLHEVGTNLVQHEHSNVMIAASTPSVSCGF